MSLTPYYSDAAVQLFHGDCREILPTIERVDHVITDPPYEAESHTLARRVQRGTVSARHWRGRNSELRETALSFAAIDEETRSKAACHFARMSRRWALVFCQAEAAHKWEGLLTENGMTRRRWCVWVKPDGQPQFSGDRPGVGYETIVACHASGRSRWNGGGRLGVFTHAKNVTGSQFSEPHPTTKPERLMEDLVSLFTDPSDLILDPFGGSGTTAVAAKRLGRRCILIEREEKYCEVAAKRLSQGALGLWAPADEVHSQDGLALMPEGPP